MTGGRVLKVPTLSDLDAAKPEPVKANPAKQPDDAQIGSPVARKMAEEAVELSPGGVPVTEANANQTLKFPEAQTGTIGRLVEVVEKLREIERLNNLMQSQFATGSPSWNLCESIDDRVHDAFVLLGE